MTKKQYKSKNLYVTFFQNLSVISFCIFGFVFIWGLFNKSTDDDDEGGDLKKKGFQFLNMNLSLFISLIFIWIGFALYFISQIFHFFQEVNKTFFLNFFKKNLKEKEENLEFMDEDSSFL